MLILITCLVLFTAALALVILHITRPNVRYIWLLGTGSALAGWLSVLSWQFRLPLSFSFPSWELTSQFSESIFFMVDSISWPFAFSVMTVTLAVILTGIARENFPAPIPWAAALILGGLGLLAVLASNPLTLLMVWAAIDITELISQLRSIDDPQASEKVVTAFATRVAGIGVLLWANMVSISNGTVLEFQNSPPQVSLYLLLAVGLRLGVLPLHLPYASESAIRRGFGTALRLISAASSLILLARIPASSATSVFTPFLLSFVAFAAVYGGWMWMRATDELTARPFWLIGLTSLAMAASLRGNPVGAAAWSCALLLSGSALFLASAHHPWLGRALWVGMLGISALPFSLTSTGWQSNVPVFWPTWPLLLLAQAMLLSGYFRHATRPVLRTGLESLDLAAKFIYPLGIGLLLAGSLLLGVWGWDGALKFGAIIAALVGILSAILVHWLIPRLRILNPVRAHWVRPVSATSTWMDWFFNGMWNIYRIVGRLSTSLSNVLEGDSGFMWTLLLLVLFISLLTQGSPTP